MIDIFNPLGLPQPKAFNRKHVFKRLPVKEIHQSWLQNFRLCKRKAYLSSQAHDGPSPYYMYMGSVFHSAFEHAVRSDDIDHWHKMANDPAYWYDVFSGVNNRPADFNESLTARKMVDVYSGTNIPLIIKSITVLLRGSGFSFKGCELKMRYQPGDGIPFVGTLDLLLERRGRLAIVDTKTSGMWNMMKDKAPSKQHYTPDQIKQHLQLRHYHWLGVQAEVYSREDVAGYGVFCPANLTRYLKGPNAGQIRGAPIFWSEVKPQYIERYEDDLVEWLRDAERGVWPRYYPGTFGKIECPRCPFNQACLGDELSDAKPEYIEEESEDLY